MHDILKNNCISFTNIITKRYTHETIFFNKNLLFYTLYKVLTSIALTRGIFLLFLTHKGLSVSEVALYSIVLNISITIFEIPTGYFGDKFGKRNSLMLGCFLLALHSFTMIISKKTGCFYDSGRIGRICLHICHR